MTSHRMILAFVLGVTLAVSSVHAATQPAHRAVSSRVSAKQHVSRLGRKVAAAVLPVLLALGPAAASADISDIVYRATAGPYGTEYNRLSGLSANHPWMAPVGGFNGRVSDHAPYASQLALFGDGTYKLSVTTARPFTVAERAKLQHALDTGSNLLRAINYRDLRDKWKVFTGSWSALPGGKAVSLEGMGVLDANPGHTGYHRLSFTSGNGASTLLGIPVTQMDYLLTATSVPEQEIFR